jgi:hypothetical protein
VSQLRERGPSRRAHEARQRWVLIGEVLLDLASMNQKMDATRSQKFMFDSFIDAERIARTRGSR